MLCDVPDAVAPHFRRDYEYIGASQTDDKMKSTTAPIPPNAVICEFEQILFRFSNFIFAPMAPFYFGAKRRLRGCGCVPSPLPNFVLFLRDPYPSRSGTLCAGSSKLLGRSTLRSLNWRDGVGLSFRSGSWGRPTCTHRTSTTAAMLFPSSPCLQPGFVTEEGSFYSSLFGHKGL